MPASCCWAAGSSGVTRCYAFTCCTAWLFRWPRRCSLRSTSGACAKMVVSAVPCKELTDHREHREKSKWTGHYPLTVNCLLVTVPPVPTYRRTAKLAVTRWMVPVVPGGCPRGRETNFLKSLQPWRLRGQVRFRVGGPRDAWKRSPERVPFIFFSVLSVSSVVNFEGLFACTAPRL